MIGRLQGKLILKQPPSLVIDVNGVGYDVQAPMSTIYELPEVGHMSALLIHTHVREDAFILYGFISAAERDLFRTLIKVSGVGAKMALTILSGISVNAFAQCVAHEDVTTLVKLPGVGKKTAERLLVEMKDKLKDVATHTGADLITQQSDNKKSTIEEAVSALMALGYKPPEASRMITTVAKDADDKSVESLIKQALQASVKK